MPQCNQTKQNPTLPSESCTVSQVIPLAYPPDQGMGNSQLGTRLILLSDWLLPQGLNLGPHSCMLVKNCTTIPSHSKNSLRGLNATHQWALIASRLPSLLLHFGKTEVPRDAWAKVSQLLTLLKPVSSPQSCSVASQPFGSWRCCYQPYWECVSVCHSPSIASESFGTWRCHHPFRISSPDVKVRVRVQ